MPLARFRVIASQIRFDDEPNRGGRWQGDRFAAIRSVSTNGDAGGGSVILVREFVNLFPPFHFLLLLDQVWTLPPPLPPSLTHCLCVKYSYSHKEVGGEGGRLEPERRGHKAGSHIPIWLTVSPVYKLWQTSRLRIIGNADVFQGNLRVVECQLRKGCPLQRPSVDRWDALSDENPCSFPVSIYSLHSGSITGYILMRIRIRLFTLMRIRIQLLKCSNQCCGTGTIGTVTFWLVDSEPEP